MRRDQALELLAAVRRSGDELAKGLARLEASKPSDLRKWQLATAAALGAIQDKLLEPILSEHPDITPPELGGPPKSS